MYEQTNTGIRELTIAELDAELAEQLPARELMCCLSSCCPHIEVEVEVSVCL